MFNLYNYEQKEQKMKEIQKQKQKYVKEWNDRRQKNEKMSDNYLKKIENFIVNMNSNPVIITDFKSNNTTNYQHREFKEIGNENRRISFIKSLLFSEAATFGKY